MKTLFVKASLLCGIASGETFASWSDLAVALDKTGASGTFALAGSSFDMTGYTTNIDINAGNVTIIGAGAVLDVKEQGSFFYVFAGASLTVTDLSLQNGQIGVSANHNAIPILMRAHLVRPEGGAEPSATAAHLWPPDASFQAAKLR
jgi:hypothetical protein